MKQITPRMYILMPKPDKKQNHNIHSPNRSQTPEIIAPELRIKI